MYLATKKKKNFPSLPSYPSFLPFLSYLAGALPTLHVYIYTCMYRKSSLVGLLTCLLP